MQRIINEAKLNWKGKTQGSVFAELTLHQVYKLNWNIWLIMDIWNNEIPQ